MKTSVSLRSIVGFFLLIASVALPSWLQTPTARAATFALDFEDLSIGQDYDRDPNTPDPDSLVTSGTAVQLIDFESQFATITNGTAVVWSPAQTSFFLPGATGKFINTGNANLDFNFGDTATQASFLFGQFGGDLNLEINGDRQIVTSMFDLPATVGGASVAVELLGTTLAGEQGRVTVTGIIQSFSVGGQEFSIDDVSYTLIPEPASAGLAAMAALAVLAFRRRRDFAI